MAVIPIMHDSTLLPPPMQTFLTWCCGSDLTQVKVVSVLRHILLDWRIWHKAEERVWEQLLWELEKLLTRENGLNRESFAKAEAIKLILLTSKVIRISMGTYVHI